MKTLFSSKVAFNRVVQSVLGLYDVREAQTIAFLLLEDLFEIEKISVMVDKECWMDIEQLEDACRRLSKGEPVQYVTEKAYFGEMRLKVNGAVLIPRPETEELARWIKDSMPKKDGMKILDIGTGSGCLAIWLAKNLPESKIFAIDISKEVLEIAQYNAEIHQTNVEFFCKDIFKENLSFLSEMDLIVSNPPYVLPSEKSQMRANVLDFEPHEALFVPENQPFLFYERILLLGKQILKNQGKIYFEINERFGKELFELLENYGYQEVEIKEDLFGKSRMIRGIFKG
ncbi:MAG: peptide chain release factor N(5)-glutamine methyltransferase [Flammeovirgaceae bacterium]